MKIGRGVSLARCPELRTTDEPLEKKSLPLTLYHTDSGLPEIN